MGREDGQTAQDFNELHFTNCTLGNFPSPLIVLAEVKFPYLNP